MRRSISSLLIGFTLAAAAPAGAQVTVQLLAPNVPSGGTVAAFGVYMSPYTGTVNGQQVVLNCDDFFHEVTLGEVWQANTTTLGGGSLALTRFGSLANALTLYQEAAWLTTQYDPNPGLNSTTSAETVAIQSAIWDLFTPSAPEPTVTGSTPNRQNASWWVTQAAADYSTAGLNYGGFTVLTGIDSRVNADGVDAQEFIVTPEPGSLILVGTGLAGLVGFVRRRKQSGNDLTA